ncbi:MAG: hypothetical protein AAF939_11155 [Planctomycetota bacterium]
MAKLIDSESGENPVRQQKIGTFSIQSFMVITAVFAATALSLAQLYRAALGDQPQRVGQFVLVTTILPTALLVGASWFLKIFKHFFQ